MVNVSLCRQQAPTGAAEHNFIPVSNALYQPEGQVMTVYTFKTDEDLS